jgi:hypothetical protein
MDWQKPIAVVLSSDMPAENAFTPRRQLDLAVTTIKTRRSSASF